MSSDLVVQGLASGLLATWLQMGKFYRQFHRINPYARLYSMDTEKGCKYNLFISSSMAKHASFPSLWVNHFVLQNLLTREVSLKLHPYWPQPFCVIKNKVLELNIYYYFFLISLFLSGTTFSLNLASSITAGHILLFWHHHSSVCCWSKSYHALGGLYLCCH
jgi:hypothetical protein